MLALSIRSEATGTAWRVWPDPEVIPLGSVQEAGRYLFELDGSGAGSADLLIDETKLEALRSPTPDSARWRWSPGFNAGSIEVELRIPGQTSRRFEIVTDPDQRKLTRDDFDTMVHDVLVDTFALFSLSAFRKGIARGVGNRPPAIARLEYLRSRVEELEAAISDIMRNPRNFLTATEEILPYHRAPRATGPEILRSLRSGRIRRETGKPSRLPDMLGGYLPERIRVRRRRSTFDLPEHREMGACMRFWAGWLDQAAELLEPHSQADDAERRQQRATWAGRCRRLAHRINRLASELPFAEARESPARLTISPVFRSDPRYRRFYRLWHEMDLGIAAVFSDFLNMPLARTFELYELWCFLRLVRAGVEEFGAAAVDLRELFLSDASGGVTLATGAVTVNVGAGWKLCFQKQYREFWIEPDGRGSFSRAMIPDVVAVNDEQGKDKRAKLIVLDAKYRVDSGLNDALSSIHMYRDALVRETPSGMVEGIVAAAYLMAPYFPETSGSYRGVEMPGRLFHPDYRSAFRFGAITLRPGMSTGEVANALKLVLGDAIATGAA